MSSFDISLFELYSETLSESKTDESLETQPDLEKVKKTIKKKKVKTKTRTKTTTEKRKFRVKNTFKIIIVILVLLVLLSIFFVFDNIEYVKKLKSFMKDKSVFKRIFALTIGKSAGKLLKNLINNVILPIIEKISGIKFSEVIVLGDFRFKLGELISQLINLIVLVIVMFNINIILEDEGLL